jgi:hypothetical protein
MSGKRRHRPGWFEKASEIIGLAAKAAALIETIRRIF